MAQLPRFFVDVRASIAVNPRLSRHQLRVASTGLGLERKNPQKQFIPEWRQGGANGRIGHRPI